MKRKWGREFLSMNDVSETDGTPFNKNIRLYRKPAATWLTEENAVKTAWKKIIFIFLFIVSSSIIIKRMTEIVACFFFSKNGWCSNSGEKPTFWMLTFKATVPSPYLKDWWNTIFFVLFSHLALCQTKQSLVNINKKWEEKEAEKTKRPDLLLNVSEQENQVSNHWIVTIGLLPLDCNHRTVTIGL